MNNYVPLGDLIKSISKTHKFDKDELVFLNTSDVLEGKILIDYYTPVSKLKGQAKKTIKNGDILYSEIRPKNKRYAYVKNVNNTEDYVVSTKLMVLRNSSEKLNTDYLYHFLTFEGTINYLQKRAENRIGSFPQITFDIVKTIKIWLPELQIQKHIAKVLSDLDAKIEVNNKINKKLEALAKTIYDYWFVQFDFPISAAYAASVGKPKLEGKPYKSSGGKMVYNEELKREIPEGWEVKELKDIESNIITGKTPSTKIEENFGGEIPFITIDDVRQSRFIYTAERTLSKLGAETQNNKYLQENDICVSCIGTVGVIGFVGKKAQSNQQINTISKPKEYNRYYLFQYLNDYFNFNTAAKKGAVLSNMNKGDFEAIPVIEPNKDLRQMYFGKVDDIFKTISNNIKQNQKLAELRDWLLPMLMNGQVAVGEAKEELGMVVEDNGTYKTT